jgi:hypothetical protein
MKQAFLISIVIVFTLSSINWSHFGIERKETCDYLISSTEITSKTITYTDSDVSVFNPFAFCDDQVKVFALKEIMVNGTKIEDIEHHHGLINIPLTTLNLDSLSDVQIEIKHYSFGRPKILVN